MKADLKDLDPWILPASSACSSSDQNHGAIHLSPDSLARARPWTLPPDLYQSSPGSSNDLSLKDELHLSVDRSAQQVGHISPTQRCILRPSHTTNMQPGARRRPRQRRRQGGFPCGECGKPFALEGEMRKHAKIHLSYSERPHGYYDCDRRFWDLKDFRRHRRRVHEKSSLQVDSGGFKRAFETDSSPSSELDFWSARATGDLRSLFGSLATEADFNSFDTFINSEDFVDVNADLDEALSSSLLRYHDPFPSDGSAPHRGARV